MATAIAKETGGKLYRITPSTAYTSADLDWNNKSSRSSIEMTTENSRPELGGEALNLERLRRDIPWLPDMVEFMSASGQYIP